MDIDDFLELLQYLKLLKNRYIATAVVVQVISAGYIAVDRVTNYETNDVVSTSISSFLGALLPSFLVTGVITLLIGTPLFYLYKIYKKDPRKKFINFFAIPFLIFSIVMAYMNSPWM